MTGWTIYDIEISERYRNGQFFQFKQAISPDFHRQKIILLVDLESAEKITTTNREIVLRIFFLF